MHWLLGAIFQLYNARSHTVRVSQDCLLTVTTLRCPACSPNLSPIEHMRDHLRRREASHEFERTSSKATENMEQNVSRYHTEPVSLNARSYRFVYSG
ncbi:hypothetical protein TNCV_2835131 [Trichonephila clavipes]|uniref:C2H2-type domain-containing protein n=1 Tax=Trichonephila clavipes TaxID=2585209 RepID=A0A8X6S158_TRICX|nr:hypothetical protein TNCV_2835131 [Trichonephila clavipes]